MIRAALLSLAFVIGVGAQEFPPASPGTLFDCTQGCGAIPGLGVQCWSYVQTGTTDHGPRCQGYCQYDGMAAHCPGLGWFSCRQDRVVGVACNVTEKVYPPAPGRTRPRVVCDGGTTDTLSEPCS